MSPVIDAPNQRRRPPDPLSHPIRNGKLTDEAYLLSAAMLMVLEASRNLRGAEAMLRRLDRLGRRPRRKSGGIHV